MPKKPAPVLESDPAIALPSYVLNIKRLAGEVNEIKGIIQVNSSVLGELRSVLDRKIMAADPTSQSELDMLSPVAQRVHLLERRAELLNDDLGELNVKLGNAVVQAKDRLISAAAKHDDLLHERELEEKSTGLEMEARENLRERSKTWGRLSTDWARRLAYRATEAAEILRLAERIFADLPAVATEEV